MDRRLLDALERHPQIDAWTVRRHRATSVQTYLVGRAVENVREVERVLYQVEVFRDHETEAGRQRGSASLPLTEADLDRLEPILDDAALMAGLVHNPPWELPSPATVAPVELADPALEGREEMLRAGDEAVALIRERTEQAARTGVRLSAAELFIDRVDEELRTSSGVDVETTSTEVMLEATLLARHDEAEAEFFRQARARRMVDLDLPRILFEGAGYARDKVRARAPRTRIGPVLVQGEALRQMMGGTVVGGAGAYLTQTDAAAAFLKIARFELGQPVYLGKERTGDPLTLRANAAYPYGVRSYRADEDGVPAHDVPLIENGILVARSASPRYGQYLDLPVTGRPGVAQVAPGSTPTADLAGEGPLYRVVAFSAANVDALSGDFGMEIRLGYEVTAEGEVPISGGSVTGNLFEIMATAHFSRETDLFADYAGPAAIRFDAIQVAGED